jgi:monoamine oxidase
LINYISEKPTEWASILNVHNSGKTAEAFSEMSCEKVFESGKKVVREMFGHAKNYKDPKIYMRSNWKVDPFAYGSFSFPCAKGPKEVFENLKQNIGGQIWFAGEATNYQFLGTVHGALMSGRDTSKEVLNYLEKENNRKQKK